MRADKRLAIQLRKRGVSYKEIEKRLGIPRSTLCGWFSGLEWSKKVKEELKVILPIKLSIAQKVRWEKLRQSHRAAAEDEFQKLVVNHLFVLGVALYWGEGDHQKKYSNVKLVNTDARIIRLFTKFLEEVAKIPLSKIKAYMILYNDLEEESTKKYWSKASGVSVQQFTKTQIIHGRHPTRKTKHGMCVIQVSSRALKERLLVWQELLYRQYNIR